MERRGKSPTESKRIITEGKVKKGGVKPKPSGPKPNVKPPSQKKR